MIVSLQTQDFDINFYMYLYLLDVSKSELRRVLCVIKYALLAKF